MARRNIPLVTIAGIAVLTLVGAGAAAGVTIWAGWYDVGASTPHPAPVESVLRYTMERSVERHARDVQVPRGMSLSDTALADRAAGHYSVVCADCHGAPGQAPASWLQLYPAAADLTRRDVVEPWTDAELFWIIKHGIGDTGMTAMAPGHGDEDVWAIAAFVRQLPGMEPDRYQRLVDEFSAARSHGDNAHGHGDGHGAEGHDR